MFQRGSERGNNGKGTRRAGMSIAAHLQRARDTGFTKRRGREIDAAKRHSLLGREVPPQFNDGREMFHQRLLYARAGNLKIERRMALLPQGLDVISYDAHALAAERKAG